MQNKPLGSAETVMDFGGAAILAGIHILENDGTNLN